MHDAQHLRRKPEPALRIFCYGHDPITIQRGRRARRQLDFAIHAADPAYRREPVLAATILHHGVDYRRAHEQAKRYDTPY